MEDSSSDEEGVKPIREALGGLVTDGLLPYNVVENGGILRELALFKDLREEPDENAGETERNEADANALRAVFEAAVEHEDISGKHRRLLRAVLPLNQELVGKSIKERRVAAGKDLKPGKKAVTAGTIRNHYEPRALDKLSVVLCRMELEFRAKAPSSQGGPADSEGSDS
jgi:hypothetical protein